MDVLVDLAKKYECDKYSALFYSMILFEDHSESHGPNKIIEKISVHEITDDEVKYMNIDESYQTDERKKKVEYIELIEKPGMLDEEIVMENGNETKLEEPFKCNICDTTFLTQSWLVRHGFSHPRLKILRSWVNVRLG